MSAASVAAPTIEKDTPDPNTGFVVMQQPITLSVDVPTLADGSQLTYLDKTTNKYTINAATAKAGFTFGALVYHITTSGAIEIFNGQPAGQSVAPAWIPQTSFDPSASSLNPSAFAFDQSSGTWSGTFVLSTIKGAGDASFATNPGGPHAGKPQYGFIAIFATPKPTASVTPTTAIRSALGTPFGVAASSNTSNVQPGLVAGTTPTQDPTKADGFAIIVTGGGVTVAELIVSGDTGLSQMVVANLYSGGVVQASIALCNDSSIQLASTQAVTIDAPVVNLTGTLQAQRIEYSPSTGGPRVFL